MTNEEMQKAMDFIVNQQAQFAADIQKLQESQTETAQLLNRLAAVTVKGFEDTNAKINALIDAQIRMDENLKTMNENLNRTDENLKKTDENLNRTNENLNRTNDDLRSLIALVDRHLREGRNGK